MGNFLVQRWSQVPLAIWIAAVLLIPVFAYVIYWFRKNFELDKISIWIAEFSRKSKPPTPELGNKPAAKTNKKLGAAFRRYFASVIDSPFYPLPDQIVWLNQAKDLLRPGEKPLVVVFSGEGGVGKTTLAAEIVRQCEELKFLKPVGDSAKLHVYETGQIQKVENASTLAWEELVNTILQQLGSPSLTARPLPEREGWLRRQLHLERYLVLIDNLESTDNARELIHRLTGLLRGSQSRGIATFRFQTLGEFRDVRTINITGLSVETSLEFLEQEISLKGYHRMQEWLDVKQDDYATLVQIIHQVDGRPLALQLVVGLNTSLPLQLISDILQDVTGDQRIEDIYRFLYFEELKLLSQDAYLKLVSAFSERKGYYLSELANIWNLPSEQTLKLLVEMINLSLVYSTNRERQDARQESYFFVHSMLHSILHKLRADEPV